MTPDYLQIFKATLPEFLLVATALLVLGADLTLWRRLPIPFRKTLAALLTTLGGCAVGWALSRAEATTVLQDGLWIAEPRRRRFKALSNTRTRSSASSSISISLSLMMRNKPWPRTS